MTEAKRELRLFDVFCIGVNTIVGSGIFILPATLAGLVGDASPFAFGLAALSALAIGACLAELAGRFDRTGGPMVYAREGFGPAAGFAVGWLNFLALVVSWAAVARGVGGYLARYWSALGTESGEAAVAVAIVAAFTAVNYVGIKPAAWITDAFTVGKLLPLLLLAAVGLYVADFSEVRFEAAPMHSWARAWFLCMFAMGGYEQVGVPAGETKNPMRSVPIGILGSVAGASLLYLAVQGAAVALVPDLAHSRAPLADAAQVAVGSAGAALLTVGAAVSMTGYTSGAAILTPRSLLALAEVGDLPRWLAAPHPRFGTPYRTILATGAIAIVLAASAGFAALADFGMVATLLCYSGSAASLLVLRKRTDLPPPRFRLPFAWFVCPLAVVIGLALATTAGRKDFLAAIALLAAGLALRFVFRRFAAASGS